jgi:cell division protein FtsI (penicillin-binding protein 3)
MDYPEATNSSLTRIRIWYGLLLLLSCVVFIRLFYLQVIQHDYYASAALAGQLKEYEIPASRGVIEVHDGDGRVPLVMNESKYTLFADPAFIDDHAMVADEITGVINIDREELIDLLKTESRYVIIKKKLEPEVKESIEALELKGVGLREVPYRAYPQGNLAAHLLGFVNDDGEGVYGIEQALDDRLRGSPGQLKAITDARGVPLAANKDNVVVEPKPGDRLLLTIDIGMQKRLEDTLQEGLKKSRSESGGALIMDVRSGAVKAMANYPTYSPASFASVSEEDVGVFQNSLVSSPLEIGSIMKPLTMAAALDQGVVQRETTYYDPNQWTVDGATITNVEESSGVGTRSMEDILRLSLNTGATWLLKQMGGGEINSEARTAWHKYMTKHYFFGEETGVEQGFEAPGVVPDPDDGYGLNIRYANTAFGQGMTATPLQAAAALAAAVNGGTYYQPRLVDGKIDATGNLESVEPAIRNGRSISPSASADIQILMERAFAKNYRTYGMQSLRDGFRIGGKTGTAQVANPDGGYYDDRFNGTFMGFVGGEETEYVIIVRVDEPRIGGYAGSVAAGPVFAKLAEILIDSFGVQPVNR